VLIAECELSPEIDRARRNSTSPPATINYIIGKTGEFSRASCLLDAYRDIKIGTLDVAVAAGVKEFLTVA